MFPIAIVQILASVAIEDEEVAVGVEEVTVLEFDTSEEVDG
jgi:hypothetical protein